MAFDTTEIETMIREHMGAQPYEAVCADCDEPLEVDTRIDNDYDLTIIVSVCKCAKQKGE